MQDRAGSVQERRQVYPSYRAARFREVNTWTDSKRPFFRCGA